MNSKYAPLESHLRDSGETSVPMTFDEIAQVIGTPLPPAAFKHRALWSNNPGNWVMTKAWLGAGYETERVHMETRELVFRKVSDVPPPATSARLAPTDGAGRAAVPGFRDIRIDAVVEDVNRRLDDVVRDLANLRERVAKIEGSLEGFLAGRRGRDAGQSVYVGDRERDLDQLYVTLEEIAEGPVGLTELSRRIVRADAGVYLFFEQGEVRRNGRPRVVRVGKSVKLQSRLLDQHLNGNHRASVFRRHVGEALIRRDRLPGLETWLKSTAPSLQTELDSERDVEESSHAGAWCDVGGVDRDARPRVDREEPDRLAQPWGPAVGCLARIVFTIKSNHAVRTLEHRPRGRRLRLGCPRSAPKVNRRSLGLES